MLSLSTRNVSCCLTLFALCLFQLSITQSADAQPAAEDTTFGIGSEAPPLDIEHWFSDGEGKFERVTQFKPGHVYVVEFWATWCPPCIASMPHLSKLQQQYQDQNVQIISISDEDYDTVEEFLKRKVSPGDEATFADVTQSYCLTTDPDESVKNDYFRAAGLSGIPSAFIVGKTGHVEWIGHPMAMDEPLKEVVDGTWDREAFAIAYREEQEKANALQRIQPVLFAKMGEIEDLIAEGKAEEGIKILDDMLSDEEFAAAKEMIVQIRQQFLVLFVGGAEGAKELLSLASEHKGNPQIISQIINAVYQQHVSAKPLDSQMLDAVIKVSDIALESDSKNINVLKPLSRFLAANNNLDRAIEVQQQLVDLTTGASQEEEQKYLAELKQKKADQDKK